MNGSIVRVKKLFPGQPAAESGKINVGDVILKVNGASLKGLSQQDVISALRGTAPEVSLLLCRPAPGVLPEIDTAFLTPLHSPAQAFLNSNKEPSQLSSFLVEQASLDKNGMCGKTKKQCKAPSRRESYSDHSESGEDESVRVPVKIPNVTPMATFAHEAPRGQEESICTMFYLPQKTPGKSESESSRPPHLLDVSPGQIHQSLAECAPSDSTGKYFTHLASQLSKEETITTLKNDLGNHLEDSEL
ncbi:tyrosine-protein phosphatase non-receptor type 13-like, partial [Grammomys surdaster]|uniref:tyrosine-protein phosphatase non-receptor type 13-like n=1 Tax=Grammomys surdaster TaxID=491861 RepID=UPI00109F3099